jgi:hypothetical protein
MAFRQVMAITPCMCDRVSFGIHRHGHPVGDLLSVQKRLAYPGNVGITATHGATGSEYGFHGQRMRSAGHVREACVLHKVKKNMYKVNASAYTPFSRFLLRNKRPHTGKVAYGGSFPSWPALVSGRHAASTLLLTRTVDGPALGIHLGGTVLPSVVVALGGAACGAWRHEVQSGL